jgi:hypothetical protein
MFQQEYTNSHHFEENLAVAFTSAAALWASSNL